MFQFCYRFHFILIIYIYLIRAVREKYLGDGAGNAEIWTCSACLWIMMYSLHFQLQTFVHENIPKVMSMKMHVILRNE